MKESYITIKQDFEHEIDIKKSRFICHLKRTETVEEAQAFIEFIQKEHWKANHNCSAFIIGENNEQQRANDDGEPSGTAGVPMLEVLKKKKIQNTTAVVTRYFGGIKLGAGGLIRAYSHAVSEATEAVGLVQGILQIAATIQISYPQLDKLKYTLEKENYYIEDISYGEFVTLHCLVEETSLPDFKNLLNATLQNQYTLSLGAKSFHEIPL